MILSFIGIALVTYVANRFISQLGKTLPIIEVMLLIAGMQWIIGPIIEYNSSFQHHKYYMYVDESSYMSYMIPAYAAFVYGTLKVLKSNTFFYKKLLKIKIFDIKIPLLFILIGLLATVISNFIPPNLKFFFHLISNLKFVGAIMFLFVKHKNLTIISYFVLLGLLVSSLSSGLFHSFILWSLFFFMFWSLKFNPSKIKITLIIFFGFLSMTLLQSIKSDYRELVWNNYNGDKLSLFSDLMIDKISSGFFENTENTSSLNVRLNQGWIISAIMYNVPRSVDLSYGSTVLEAISASVLPRFLNPIKKQAGGRDNFEKYTGLSLGANTSMGISLVGEAYANFYYFGFIFMLLIGMFFSYIFNVILKNAKKNTLIIYFLPLVFLQVIKAETELLVVLNHLVKSLFFIFIVIKSLKILNIKFNYFVL